MSDRFAELATLPASELEALLRSGLPFDVETLGDSLWHGYSLAMAAPVFKLFGRFGKAFVRDPVSGRIRGWNVRMRQGVDAWTPALFRGRAVTYGHYEVIDEPQGQLSDLYPNAFMIDYGKGGNPRLDPTNRVRDPIVALVNTKSFETSSGRLGGAALLVITALTQDGFSKCVRSTASGRRSTM